MLPLLLWSRMIDSGIALSQTGYRFAELMQASTDVIAHRSADMADAARDPLHGDYQEMARMVPEKVAAFGSAAASAADDLRLIQADAFANWRQMAAIATSGRAPRLADLDAIGNRTVRMTERALAAGGKAMRPVHKAATGNAKRLKARPAR